MAKSYTDYNHIISKTFISMKGKLGELVSEGRFNTVERWNNQLDMEAEEHQVLLPALYIEIMNPQWEVNNWELRKGWLHFCIHVCTETPENFDIEDWENNQAVHDKLEGFAAAGIHTAFEATDSKINHNYNVVIDNMLYYRTFVNDESLLRLRTRGTIGQFTETVTKSDS